MNYTRQTELNQVQKDELCKRARAVLDESEDLLKNVEIMQKHSKLYYELFNLNKSLLRLVKKFSNGYFAVVDIESLQSYEFKMSEFEEVYFQKDYELENYFRLLEKLNKQKEQNYEFENSQQFQQPRNSIQFEQIQTKFIKRDKWIALLLCFFLGTFGIHKFYEEKYVLGILYLFTSGLLFFGVIFDIFVLLFKPNPYYLQRRSTSL